MEFSSFKINPNADKYLFNTFDSILSMQHNETSGPEIENEDKKNIENLDSHFFLSKGDI